MSVGIAIIEIARIQRVLDNRSHSLGRWFTGAELERISRRARAAEELAGRFACKLAVRSTLEGHLPDRERIRLYEVVTLNDPLGKPLVLLSDRLATLLAGALGSGTEVHVSITHARDYAAAVAVIGTGRPA
jgi:holo-[acyl-carrier-protein] synthase